MLVLRGEPTMSEALKALEEARERRRQAARLRHARLDAELVAAPEVPTFAERIGGDNRPVPVPLWLAKEILADLERSPKPSRAAYAAGRQGREDDLRRLIALAETGVDPAGAF